MRGVFLTKLKRTATAAHGGAIRRRRPQLGGDVLACVRARASGRGACNVRLLGGDSEARQRAQSSAMAVSRRGSEKFRTRPRESGSETTGKRRGSTEWLTGSVSVPRVGQAEDRDDEATVRFRSGRSEEELVVGVLPLPGLVGGVVEVEGDVAVLLVPLAQCEDDHGVAAALSRPH